MTLNIACQLMTALSLLGTVFLSAACSSSASTASPNNSAGSAGLSSNGGVSATAGTGGNAGTSACPDVMGRPVPANFGNCDSGACFSCPVTVQRFPWVNGMFSNTDASGATKQTLSNPAGKVCMSGTSLEYAALTLTLGTGPAQPCSPNDELTCIFFDANALGITQLEFTLETPPSGGVTPQLDAVVIALPPAAFDWAGGGVSTTTPQRASLNDFLYPNLTLELDLSKVVVVAFNVRAAEYYDFCVRDLKFLNAAGVEVLPP